MSEEEVQELKACLAGQTVAIGDKKYQFNLPHDLFINPGNLNGEFAEHSERFAWYSTAFELAQDWEKRLKVALERCYAQEDYKARMELTGAGIKFTEKMIEATVTTSAAYMQLTDAYLEAQKNTGLLKAARDAMIHRRDMLVGMGANYRAEGRSDIFLKAEHTAEHSE